MDLTLFNTTFLVNIPQKQEYNTKYEVPTNPYLLRNSFLQQFAVFYWYIIQIQFCIIVLYGSFPYTLMYLLFTPFVRRKRLMVLIKLGYRIWWSFWYKLQKPIVRKRKNAVPRQQHGSGSAYPEPGNSTSLQCSSAGYAPLMLESAYVHVHWTDSIITAVLLRHFLVYWKIYYLDHYLVELWPYHLHWQSKIDRCVKRCISTQQQMLKEFQQDFADLLLTIVTNLDEFHESKENIKFYNAMKRERPSHKKNSCFFET